LRRAISSDGQTITADRSERGQMIPLVALVATYRCQRLRMATRFSGIPAFRMLPMSPQDVTMPRHSVIGATGPVCDVMIVEPGDLAGDTLVQLVQVAKLHQTPLIWLGEPPIAQRLATSTLPGGMLPPQSSVDQIERTLAAAVAGLTVMHPDFVHVVDQTETTSADDDVAFDSGPVLSPREQEVLTHVAHGLPNKGIARMLGITDHTVKFHVSSVLSKLNAASRTEAVAIAARRGMIDD
jgi:DNA-binding NarL/FixJ family response regulator